jgi:hypothetical protein
MGTLSPPSRVKVMFSALPANSPLPHSKLPGQDTSQHGILGKEEETKKKKRRTVVVAKDRVEVELGLDGLAGGVVEDGTENVAVVDADVLSGGVERHGVYAWIRCR